MLAPARQQVARCTNALQPRQGLPLLLECVCDELARPRKAQPCRQCMPGQIQTAYESRRRLGRKECRVKREAECRIGIFAHSPASASSSCMSRALGINERVLRRQFDPSVREILATAAFCTAYPVNDDGDFVRFQSYHSFFSVCCREAYVEHLSCVSFITMVA